MNKFNFTEQNGGGNEMTVELTYIKSENIGERRSGDGYYN